jgi:hypothetical protein
VGFPTDLQNALVSFPGFANAGLFDAISLRSITIAWRDAVVGSQERRKRMNEGQAIKA